MGNQEQERKSLFYYWRHGFMTRGELVRSAVPLQEFLAINGSLIHPRFYPLIYNHFQEKGMDIIFKGKTHPRYLVDAELANPANFYVAEMEEAVLFNELRKKRENTGSEEERQFYKQQILRVAQTNPVNPEKPWRHKKREYVPITIEDANQRLYSRALRYFTRHNLPNPDQLAEEAVYSSQVYLEGGKGTFQSFSQFMRGFGRIIYHIRVDQMRHGVGIQLEDVDRKAIPA